MNSLLRVFRLPTPRHDIPINMISTEIGRKRPSHTAPVLTLHFSLQLGSSARWPTTDPSASECVRYLTLEKKAVTLTENWPNRVSESNENITSTMHVNVLTLGVAALAEGHATNR